MCMHRLLHGMLVETVNSKSRTNSTHLVETRIVSLSHIIESSRLKLCAVVQVRLRRLVYTGLLAFLILR